MDKKQLTERDICTKYITPALARAGWDIRFWVMANCYKCHLLQNSSEYWQRSIDGDVRCAYATLRERLEESIAYGTLRDRIW
jgi:hypothetical protein